MTDGCRSWTDGRSVSARGSGSRCVTTPRKSAGACRPACADPATTSPLRRNASTVLAACRCTAADNLQGPAPTIATSYFEIVGNILALQNSRLKGGHKSAKHDGMGVTLRSPESEAKLGVASEVSDADDRSRILGYPVREPVVFQNCVGHPGAFMTLPFD